MKIVVIKSPKILSGILRVIFKIKKERVNQFLNSFTLYHIIILSKKEF